jgi:hypothetical protein
MKLRIKSPEPTNSANESASSAPQPESRAAPAVRSRCKLWPRHEYTLTAKGSLQVRAAWRAYLDREPPTDFDSLLRIIHMAVRYRAARPKLRSFLERAVEDRRQSARTMQADDQQLFTYSALRKSYDRTRLASEAETLTAVLARMLPDAKQNEPPAMI